MKKYYPPINTIKELEDRIQYYDILIYETEDKKEKMSLMEKRDLIRYTLNNLKDTLNMLRNGYL